MKLSGIFLGAALVTGTLMAPAALYKFTDYPETVRARVTGKVEASEDPDASKRPYFIYPNKGKFDTFNEVPGVKGADIKEGAFYEFNLKSANIQLWPPSYSRSIKSAKLVEGPRQ